MVAEADGDLPLQEEERGGEPRRGQRQEVDVNPFWSSRAVDAARLRAMRPEGLPKVPDTVSPQKVETEMDAWGGVGGAPEGDLPGQERDGVGGHPDAAGSRTRTEEFWSEIKRDLTADLENAGNAGMANGGEHGLHKKGRRPGDGHERSGHALLHGNGREPPHHGDLRPGEGQGPSGKGIGRPGIMRGRAVEREAELRGPGGTEGGVGAGPISQEDQESEP